VHKFVAKAVAVAELTELETFVVFLAENPDGSGERLELQRALAFDAQDQRLGQDTYCIVNESQATSYGGVTSWRLLEATLEIVLDDRAAKVFGVDGFLVTLEVDAVRLGAVRDGLLRVFGEV